MLDRVLRGVESTIYATFSLDGTPTNPNPDSATVTITREDGTALITGASAYDAGTGVFSYTLTPDQTVSLDVLTVVWTVTYDGFAQSLQTVVEVVGGFLFTLAQIRAKSPLSDATTYPNDHIVAARTLAEDALERACGVAFVPRYFREKVDGTGTHDILLPPRVLTVDSVTIGKTSASAGTVLSDTDLADLERYPDGRLYRRAAWPYGRRNIEVVGSYGYASVPPWVSEGAMALAKRWLVDTPLDVRASAVTAQDGSSQIITAEGVFDVPEADRVVKMYGLDYGVA